MYSYYGLYICFPTQHFFLTQIEDTVNLILDNTSSIDKCKITNAELDDNKTSLQSNVLNASWFTK